MIMSNPIHAPAYQWGTKGVVDGECKNTSQAICKIHPAESQYKLYRLDKKANVPYNKTPPNSMNKYAASFANKRKPT